MKTYELINIPAQPEHVELRAIALLCDLCQKTIKHYREDGTVVLNPVMRERYGNAVDVQVSLKAGELNLDGGAGETTSFDICPRCFEEDLKPWLESRGAEARVEAWG